MKHLKRGGRFFRVCDPAWQDALDTSFSKLHGGRWNPPGEFGALYLCATILVAAANARKTYEGEIATLYDLRPEQRPDLQTVDVKAADFVDAVTLDGIRGLRLPVSYPEGAGWKRCQRIARTLYAAEEHGIIYRSAADSNSESPGEELAIFDSSLSLTRRRDRLRFEEWYPVETFRERFRR